MSQTQRRPEERRPSEVQVPRLSREEVEQRAGRAYDAAVSGVLRTQFRPPPAAELSAFRRAVDARVRAGEQVDVGRMLGEYSSAHPDSAIARYNRLFQGDTTWLLDDATGRLGFRSAEFVRLSRQYLSPGRQNVIDALVRLADPRNREVPIDASAFDAAVMAAMTEQISSQIRAGANQIPATMRFESDGGRILVATLLPPPEQDYDFGKGKKG